ncbi:MAG TPA: hypothetical protein PLK99_08290, partial [Burkholderiales bacterium]|nr:hypothetical protein [Burkholderiales bacterium]
MVVSTPGSPTCAIVVIFFSSGIGMATYFNAKFDCSRQSIPNITSSGSFCAGNQSQKDKDEIMYF